MQPLLALGQRPVIGHRGASGEAPENTLEALELAVSQGADALELDVRLSADGVPVVIHDAALERTTDRRGEVRTLTLAELQAADAGYHFTPDGGRSYPWRGLGVRIPTLAEVLERFPDTPMLVELKTPGVSEAARSAIAAHRAAGRVVLGSFHERALEPVCRPPYTACASRPWIAGLKLRTVLGLPGRRGYPRAYAVPDFYRRIEVPTRRFVRATKTLGCPVHVWTVNDPDRAALLWERGVNGIITNFPAVMIARRSSVLR
ncbi:MAG: glycerophosphodiester phosphodiesterase [Gemmatimonadales bacterium]